MYVPKHYEETRIEVLHELIRANPLGVLVTLTSGELDANHIPFEIAPGPQPFGTLRGHIARANPLWRDVPRDVEALVVFQGPSAYVSPSWYPRKRETGKVVPTWFYAVVHAHGPLQIIDDKTWLRDFVETLTNRHEAGRDEPWKVSDAPADYIDNSIRAIVGIEIPVSRLIGKWKVNQHRSAEDHAGVVEGLLQEGHESAEAVVNLMRQI